MDFDRLSAGALEYNLYRFRKSKTLFRGPRPDLSRRFCACFGSTETFGKFVPDPFPDRLSRALKLPVANFSSVNGGVEMVLKDPSILLAANEAAVNVVAMTGAHNLSNRYYTVHPRRNDRFLYPSKMLMTIYHDVDFSDIHYTRHLLATLAAADIVKFGLVIEELKQAWLARMKTLLSMMEGRIVLLWMADHAPGPATLDLGPESLFGDPLFIDQDMMDHLSPSVTRVVEVISDNETLAQGQNDMVFSSTEAEAAASMPNAAMHQLAANTLAPVLEELL